MIRFLLVLLSLPVLALSQGSTNDYLLSQKPASGPLVVRPVTPAVGRLLGWPTSINTPTAITLGTGLSLSGSTLNATASSAWGDLTGIPAAITTLSSATAAGLALMDDADAAAQRTTLGLGTLATQSGTLTDYLTTATAATTYQPLSATLTTLSSATAAGLALMDDANAAAQRTTLGLGTLATQSGTLTDYLTTATAATTYQPLSATLTTLSSATAAGLALMDDADATAQRTTLGLGTLATQSGTFSGTSSGTNTGDNAVNSNYSGLVTNATHTGDATGATALTLATVNSDVGSYGSATAAPAVTVNAKGLVTAVTTNTITPAVGSITGLGTGVSTFLGTPTLANLNTAVSDADLATTGANTYSGLQQFSGTTHAGIRLNNLTTAERDAISSPAAGMAIWNTTDGRLQLHNGSAWTSGMVRLSGDTMTGALSVSLSALGTTSTAGASLINSTVASSGSGNQQVSPALLLRGNGWKTTATAASQTVDFIQDVLPVQGTTAPTGTWRLRTSINGGAAANVMEVDSVGAIYLPNGAAGATGKVFQYNGGVVEIGPGGITTRLSGPSLIGVVYPGNSSTAGSFQSDGTGNIAMRGSYDPSLAQELSIYKVDSGANDELAKIGWRSSTNVFVIETVKTGTATVRPISIRTGGTERIGINADGVTSFIKPPVLPVYTVDTLPATAAAGMVQGAMAVVTDAQNSNHHGTLTGGGSVVICVFYNGTAWIAY
jgi:hypothetical protein